MTTVMDNLRLLVPLPTRDDLIRLAFDEICAYAATSVHSDTFGKHLLSQTRRIEQESQRCLR